MEILAPAGGWEQLIAAVRSGADAVYLGAGAFNARRNAQNFAAEDLSAAAAYCRGRGVRVYVTINTLLKDSETEELYGLMRSVAQSGADAVIIQDLGVMALFREHLPDMPRHASTQMTVHNAEGAKAARELGFSRVVLARELTLREIRTIAEKTDIELECFVHGALCMSVSGQCGLSSMLGGRSGNRGLCAQPCRLDFRAGGRPYALSLKDMSYIGHLRELETAGVVSLKIEGRMKRPEYVAAATDACVRALRGEKPDMDRLGRIFSRGGFTDGYLTGKRGLDMFGRRTEENAAESMEEIAGVRELYRRELSRAPVDMELTIKPGEPARLTVTDGKEAAIVWGDLPERAERNEIRAEDSLRRTGGTPFVLRSCRTDIENGYTSKLNPLRRQALEKLLELRSKVKPWSFIGDLEKPEARYSEREPELRLRFAKKEQMFEGIGEETIYVPVGEIDAELIGGWGDKLVGELPRLVYPLGEAKLEKLLSGLKEKGLSRVCAGNIGTVRLARRLGFRVSGGFDLNIMNTKALKVYEGMGLEDALLSYEISFKDARGLGGSLPRGLITYGYLPLMLCRNCPLKSKGGCRPGCGGSGQLLDRRGKSFTVLCRDGEYSEILNSAPLYIGDRDLRGIEFALLYFTKESAADCLRAYRLHKNGQAYDGARTTGLYYRRLL